MIENVTLDQVLKDARTTQQQLQVRIIMLMRYNPKPKYSDFISIVEDALDLTATEFSASRDQIKGYDEDQLTDKALYGLKMLGLTARREQATNGHVDLTVEGPFEMVWLGEAKIYKSYVELIGGFRQLCDRYSTGLPEQSRGGMLIYFKVPRLKDVMEEWQKYLLDSYEGMAAEACSKNQLAFITQHDHPATGLPYHVRHVPVSIFHEPTDDQPAPKRERRRAA